MISKYKIFLVSSVFCLFAILYALIAENYLGFEPCPLCMVERFLLIIVLILSLFACIHKSNNRYVSKIYAFIIILISGFDIKVALHHQWIIDLPKDQQPLSCGAPLASLFHSIPVTEFLQKVLSGSAECGMVTWKVFGFLSPPIAVVILCLIIILMMLIVIANRNKH